MTSSREVDGQRRRTIVVHQAAAELRDNPDEVDLERKLAEGI